VDAPGGERLAEMEGDVAFGRGGRGEAEVAERNAAEIDEVHAGRDGGDGDGLFVDEVNGRGVGGKEQSGEQQGQEELHGAG
jgi:hypothetical protein